MSQETPTPLRFVTDAERKKSRNKKNAGYANSEAFVDPRLEPWDLTPPEHEDDSWLDAVFESDAVELDAVEPAKQTRRSGRPAR